MSGRSVLWLAILAGCPVAARADIDFTARTGAGPLRAAQSGLCLTVPGGKAVETLAIEQQPCSGGAEQTWLARPLGNGISLVNQATGLCMDSQTYKDNGRLVRQIRCMSVAQQAWFVQAQGAGVRLTSANSGRCLDISGASLAAGATANQWDCAAVDNQTFLPTAVPTGPSAAATPPAPTPAAPPAPVASAMPAPAAAPPPIAASAPDTGTPTGAQGVPGEPAPATASILIDRRSGGCLDADAGAATQQVCRDLPSQNWTFVPTAGGYQIRSGTTGQCLAVRDAGMASGTGVVQQDCSGAANALFRLRKLDKWFEIVATHSGQCLGPGGEGDLRDPGLGMVQQNCDTSDPQRWTILGAEGRAPSAWTSPRAIGIVPVAGAVLPNGKVMFWAAEQKTAFGSGNGTWTTLYDPSTDQSVDSYIAQTGHDMFCPGTNVLPDGRILITGGITAGLATVYDPASNTWSRVAQMNIARGYNASTTLSNGDALTYGGSWSGGTGGKDGEVWSSAGNTWRVLRNVKGDAAADPSVAIYPGDTHFWLFAQSNGSVFHAGPSSRMHWIDTNGDGALRDAGTRGADGFTVNGTATMYDIGKIFKAGGAPAYTGVPAVDTAYTIDITSGPGGTPVVADAAPMLFARAYVNSVALPDGDVVSAGGQNVAAQFTDTLAVMMPEIWSPRSGKVRRLAPMAVPRNYHSIGMLLLDGRVLYGGGGLCGDCGGADHLDFEILSPPYLFDGNGNPASRPTIVRTVTSANLGGMLAVTTDRPVTSFALMRLGSVTHSTNNDQRRVPLGFATTGPTSYQLKIPGDPGIVLPGSWMLFALDANGVPSVAKVVRIR